VRGAGQSASVLQAEMQSAVRCCRPLLVMVVHCCCTMRSNKLCGRLGSIASDSRGVGAAVTVPLLLADDVSMLPPMKLYGAARLSASGQRADKLAAAAAAAAAVVRAALQQLVDSCWLFRVAVHSLDSASGATTCRGQVEGDSRGDWE
jgi:hypothetical protein